jgi:hypothetical protein
MKPNQLVAIILGTVLMLLPARSLRAQPYSIDWFTIDGGGGTSTGAVFSISGTIGQPDAGHLSGGLYTLDGGFWGILAAVQSPDAPRLRIVLTPTNSVVLAWPAPTTGFSLEQNPAIGTSDWSVVTNAPKVVGTENQVILLPPTGNRFFRLKHPSP